MGGGSSSFERVFFADRGLKMCACQSAVYRVFFFGGIGAEEAEGLRAWRFTGGRNLSIHLSISLSLSLYIYIYIYRYIEIRSVGNLGPRGLMA